MDKEIEKEIEKAIGQPIEGLLYDLDLMPEQIKSQINYLRMGVIEVQYKRIERLREVGAELIDKMCDLCKIINPQHERCNYCEEQHGFVQALKK